MCEYAAIIDPLCSTILREKYGLSRVFQLRQLSREFNARVSEFLQTHVGEIVGKILAISEQQIIPEIVNEQFTLLLDEFKGSASQPSLHYILDLDYRHIADEAVRQILDGSAGTFPSPSNLAETFYYAGLPIIHIIRAVNNAFYFQLWIQTDEPDINPSSREYFCSRLNPVETKQRRIKTGKKLFQQLIAQNRFNIDLSADDEVLDEEIANIRDGCLTWETGENPSNRDPYGGIPYPILQNWQKFLPIITRLHRADVRRLHTRIIKHPRLYSRDSEIHLDAWRFMSQVLEMCNYDAAESLCVFCDYNPNVFFLFAKNLYRDKWKTCGLLRFLAFTENLIKENPQKMKPSPVDEW
ncbi:MAG: hypothetical protein M0R33_18935 [Methylomonas sp.]|jgi:hypothetical protein|uniref:hypothetical protein n=1 Tax=Methylomonas sp. TaxID=418 RepID=UPI0025DFCDE2|nr:hypothetical protein [Methylomonas sp.]MCK9608521.1 hypothetical protein [Methylomonas sp.]